MLYNNENIKESMLIVLEDRTINIANSIQALMEAGYIPNKNKITILDWSSILFHAYENINVFTKEQHNKLDRLYNKILKL